MADENRNDLVLSSNEYAYVLDTTKGQGSLRGNCGKYYSGNLS